MISVKTKPGFCPVLFILMKTDMGWPTLSVM